jgi:hypothetical protein
MVFNPKMFQLMRIKGGWPDDEAQFNAWCQAGAHNLAITGQLLHPIAQGAEPGWPWHLVARVGKYLVDPSARQFQRPEHGIDAPNTLVTVVPASWDSGEQTVQVMTEAEAMIMYTAQPDVDSYIQASGWRRHAINLDAAREVAYNLTEEIRRLKAN